MSVTSVWVKPVWATALNATDVTPESASAGTEPTVKVPPAAVL